MIRVFYRTTIYTTMRPPKVALCRGVLSIRLTCSGLLRCSECGANIVIVSGRWRGRTDLVYGCPQNAYRREIVCRNGVRIFRRELEDRLLSAIQEQILKPQTVEYILERFGDEFVKVMQDFSGDLERMRQRKRELEREVANLANVVAQCDFSPALRAALVGRDREIGEIAEKLLGTDSDSIQSRLHDIRARILTKTQNLRAILNSDVLRVRTELAKHIDKITLNPQWGHLHSVGDLEFLGKWQFSWCRGHGMPDTATG